MSDNANIKQDKYKTIKISDKTNIRQDKHQTRQI